MGRVKGVAPKTTLVGKKSPTASAQFTTSLSILMQKMLSCDAHFVRCIKPNMEQKKNNFVDKFVDDQLRYTGMLETCRIRREGYSYRPTFEDFMERFGLIAFGPMHAVADRSTCTKVMEVRCAFLGQSFTLEDAIGSHACSA